MDKHEMANIVYGCVMNALSNVEKPQLFTKSFLNKDKRWFKFVRQTHKRHILLFGCIIDYVNCAKTKRFFALKI